MIYRFILLISAQLFLSLNIFGQEPQQKVLYIIDSIPIINDPEEGNELNNEDIADITVIRNKDSLHILGYDNIDGVIYIFTKEYRKRPDEVKSIPSSYKMEKKNGVWYYRGSPYTGKFIDYYNSGRKQGEGNFVNGRAEGHRIMLYQNGELMMEREYSGGIENGIEKEYYEDGKLRQKGAFLNGKEDGVWAMYFPNGQVRQSSTFKNGVMEGETTVYYSTGKILSVEISKNGKSIPDKRLEKVYKEMNRGHGYSSDGNY